MNEVARITRKIKGCVLFVLLTAAAHVAESSVLRFWWSADEANAVTSPDTVFATNTVFNPFPASVTNTVLCEAEISAHLTQGIPALSRALGSVAVSYEGSNSFDMNGDTIRDRPNNWPNSFEDLGRAWLHSDIKDIPYFYTYPKFDLIVTEGGLR